VEIGRHGLCTLTRPPEAAQRGKSGGAEAMLRRQSTILTTSSHANDRMLARSGHSANNGAGAR
jgi:hypothetical protein